MAIVFERLQKPLRQLRRLLRCLQADPVPAEVHRLRTRVRQVEAIVAALPPAADGPVTVSRPATAGKLARRLLKSIRPVRKAAGRVRDMDVLCAHALTLQQEPYRDAVARLVERLQLSRKKYAAELLDVVDRRRKAARGHLSQYAKELAGADDAGPRARATEQQAQQAAARLTAELSRWPRLTARNVHSFRLKVKELRAVLQLLPTAERKFVDALGTVKEKIGEWHDWQQLAITAAEAPDAQQDGALLARIKKTGRQKLRAALAAAEALRKNYLERPAKKPPASERALRTVTSRPDRVA